MNFVRLDFACQQADGFCVDAATTYPNPSLIADPLCTTSGSKPAAIFVSAPDQHRGAVGILCRHPELRGRVPEGISRWVLALTLHLDWSRVIEAESPVRDVHVV